MFNSFCQEVWGIMHTAMKRSRPQPIGDRIRQGRLQLGLSQGQVAERTGLTQTSLSRYETEAANPSEPSLRLLAAIFDKPYEWFFGEEDEPQGDSGRVNAPESAAQSEPDALGGILSLDQVRQEFSTRFDRLETYIRAQAPVQAIAESRTDYDPSNYEPSDRSPVRLEEVASAAGVGAEVYDETPVGLLWFRNDWLVSHSIDPEQSNIISVRGASMEPTLPDGCSILVDRKRREPQEGRIYVMRTEEGLVVKRLGLDEEGRWELLSDSPDWRATPMSHGTEIIGEVRWLGRTF